MISRLRPKEKRSSKRGVIASVDRLDSVQLGQQREWGARGNPHCRRTRSLGVLPATCRSSTKSSFGFRGERKDRSGNRSVKREAFHTPSSREPYSIRRQHGTCYLLEPREMGEEDGFPSHAEGETKLDNRRTRGNGVPPTLSTSRSKKGIPVGDRRARKERTTSLSSTGEIL